MAQLYINIFTSLGDYNIWRNEIEKLGISFSEFKFIMLLIKVSVYKKIAEFSYYIRAFLKMINVDIFSRNKLVHRQLYILCLSCNKKNQFYGNSSDPSELDGSIKLKTFARIKCRDRL